MKNGFFNCFVVLVLLSGGATKVAHAQTLQGFATKLVEIFTTVEVDGGGDVAYGGCAAKVDPAIGIPPAGCHNRWVSFDCAGAFISKADGRNNYSGAQLALVTDTQVYLVVNTTRTLGGYCLVERINNSTVN